MTGDRICGLSAVEIAADLPVGLRIAGSRHRDDRVPVTAAAFAEARSGHINRLMENAVRQTA